MQYPVELLLTRAECRAVLADTAEDIGRAEFRITALTRSNTLQTTEATADVAEMTALAEQITPLAVRVAGMSVGTARTNEEIKLRALRRSLEELQDEQLKGSGSRGAFRRRRELDAAQRQLAGFQDCKTQVQTRHDALPA